MRIKDIQLIEVEYWDVTKLNKQVLRLQKQGYIMQGNVTLIDEKSGMCVITMVKPMSEEEEKELRTHIYNKEIIKKINDRIKEIDGQAMSIDYSISICRDLKDEQNLVYRFMDNSNYSEDDIIPINSKDTAEQIIKEFKEDLERIIEKH